MTTSGDASETRAAQTQSLAGRLRRLAGDTFRGRLREFTLVPVLVVVFIVGALVNKSFLTPSNIVYNILQQSAVLSIVVIAESLILITGNFDLSLESTVGLAPMVAVWLMTPSSMGGSGYTVNPFLAMAVLLAIGLAIGFMNGLLVVKLKMNAFIVTLAVLILLRGVTLGITNGKTLSGLPAEFLYFGSGNWIGVPVAVWIALGMFVAAELFMKYHRTGRAIYALGGNPDAARAAGVQVERITRGLFVLGSVLAAFAGLVLTGRIASVTAAQGQNLIFSVFAAAVIGGISMNGGRGRMIGALTGVLLLGTITNILTLSQIPSFWIDAAYGAIILLALFFAKFTTSREGRA